MPTQTMQTTQPSESKPPASGKGSEGSAFAGQARFVADVQAYRRRTGYTLRDVARMAGVDVGQLSKTLRFEATGKELSRGMADAVGRLLKVSAETFGVWRGFPTGAAPAEPPPAESSRPLPTAVPDVIPTISRRRQG